MAGQRDRAYDHAQNYRDRLARVAHLIPKPLSEEEIQRRKVDISARLKIWASVNRGRIDRPDGPMIEGKTSRLWVESGLWVFDNGGERYEVMPHIEETDGIEAECRAVDYLVEKYDWFSRNSIETPSDRKNKKPT